MNKIFVRKVFRLASLRLLLRSSGGTSNRTGGNDSCVDLGLSGDEVDDADAAANATEYTDNDSGDETTGSTLSGLSGSLGPVVESLLLGRLEETFVVEFHFQII